MGTREFRRFSIAILTVTGAVLLYAGWGWCRLMSPPAMADVRDLAEKAPLVFRGHVLEVTNGAEVPNGESPRVLIAHFQIDRVYRGKKPEQALLHFRFGNQANGHDCVNFQADTYWLVFAVQQAGFLTLFDDCKGGLAISSRLAAPVGNSGWLAQMEADFTAGLDDSDPRARIFSIQRLGGLKLASSRPVLQRVIEQREGEEREWAIYAALRTGDASVLPLVNLMLIFRNREPPMGPIKHELQFVSDPNATPDLLTILGNTPADDDFTRSRVLIALAERLKDRRAVPVLAASLSSNDNEIRYLALEGLSNMTGVEACNLDRSAKNIEPQVARCKRWWEEEGKLQVWTQDRSGHDSPR
jgi:hypothetical protein